MAMGLISVFCNMAYAILVRMLIYWKRFSWWQMCLLSYHWLTKLLGILIILMILINYLYHPSVTDLIICVGVFEKLPLIFSLYEFHIHTFSLPLVTGPNPTLLQDLLCQLSLSRLVGNKTPGLCCKTSSLQKAVPNGEVKEIQRAMKQEVLTRVHLCNRYFSEPLSVWTRVRVRSSLKVRKSLTAPRGATETTIIHAWVCKLDLLSVQNRALHDCPYSCANGYPSI